MLESLGLVEKNVATLEESTLPAPFRWFTGLNQFFKRNDVHRFDISHKNSYFFLDKSSEYPGEFYMTAYKASVEVKDFIKIEHGLETVTYLIEDISFYADPSDMWMARLRVLPSN